MARWKLMEPHYLNVDGIEWEYTERNQTTQRMQRHIFPVPLHLDPRDPADHTDKANEMIVVSNGNNAGPRDIVFSGPPTPGMEPLDEEAEALSAMERPKWTHPIESLNGQMGPDFSQSLITAMEKKMSEILLEQGSKPQYAKGVDPDAFAQLQQQVAEMLQQNAMLIEQNKSLVEQLSSKSERRV